MAVTFIALLYNVLAFVQVYYDADFPSLRNGWETQYLILLAFSSSLIWLSYVTRRASTRAVLLLGRLVTYVLIKYIVEDYSSAEIALLFSIIVEVCFYFSFPVNLSLCSVCVILSILLSRPLRAWRIQDPGFDLYSYVYFAYFSALFLALNVLLNLAYTGHEKERRNGARLDHVVRRLTSANLEFQSYSVLVQTISAEEERKRIVRELHDTVAYTMSNITMLMEAAIELSQGTSQAVFEILCRTRDQAVNGLAETRNALRTLRQVSAPPEKGVRSLVKLASVFQEATGVTVKIDYGNLPNVLGDELESAVFRMLQEGMVNALRHGKASQVDIHFFQDEQLLHIWIRDNGSGAADLVEGIGLVGMRERIGRLGGTIAATSEEEGFQLYASIPCTL